MESLPKWFQSVENVLSKADLDSRSQLYEHEVYEILEYMGIQTPKHVVVRHIDDITPQMISLFGSQQIVLKVISSNLAHKQKVGGVKVIVKDTEFARYTYQKMMKGIEKQGIIVKGVLIVEYIEYSKELGNEILLGFRESEDFGPVISFSKGGSDAGHFASHFSVPNLILPPIDRDWASALLTSTKIYKKYKEEEHSNYISNIVETAMKFSQLATLFSNFFPSHSKYVLCEFEVNPFIFNGNQSFIGIDGYATFSPKEKETLNRTLLDKTTLKPIFEPNGIAVVGVSENDSNKPGNIIAKNLFDLKREDVYCINRKGGETSFLKKTVKLYPSLLDINQPIDLAIITVPAGAALPVVKECAQKGVRGIVLIPGGFSETTGTDNLEQDILSICRNFNIRIIGPNCLGIIHAPDSGLPGINSFFIPEKKFKVNLEKDKNVAILSQSGAMGIMEIYNLRDSISPKVIVSYGNQLDVDSSDLIQYLEDDPAIDVMGVYIEGFKKGAGRTFFNTASKSSKPIIVYKAGRTPAGQMAMQSHTASMAGEYEIVKAAMKQAGMIVADTMIDHGDFVKTFALLNDFKVTGRRVAVIANAGFEKTYAADNIGSLTIADLDSETINRLKKILPPYVTVEPLLDLTPMVADEQYTECIEIMLQSKQVDALCISIVPHSQVIHTTDEEIESYKKNIAARIVELVHTYKKPVVVSVNVVSGADAVYNKFGQVMDKGGVPTFLTAGRAMTCLNEFIRYKLIKEKNVISEWLK